LLSPLMVESTAALPPLLKRLICRTIVW